MTITADNGYYFGLGVFETIDVVAGRCIFLDEHLARLEASAAFFGLNSRISPKDVSEYLKTQGQHHYTGGLKITISQENTIFSLRENPYTQEDYKKAFRLTFNRVRRNETSPFTYHKTLNQGDNLQERAAAKEQGFDEGIFLNSIGEITEGTLSNIFFVKSGGIFTPPVSSGLLNGIMRQYIISAHKVTEVALTPGAIEKFDECFITNSLMGIMPVRSLGDKEFQSFDVALRLKAYYDYKKASYNLVRHRNENPVAKPTK